MDNKEYYESPADGSHWKLKFFYFNKEDKRTMVPGRNPKYGPTFNFASATTYLFLVAVIVVVLLMAVVPDFIAGKN